MRVTESAGPFVECRCYTQGRRHPWIIGTLLGWRLPVLLTFTQGVVIYLGARFMLRTEPFWTALLSGVWSGFESPIYRYAAMAGLVGAMAWLVRYVRVEGRAVGRYLLALLVLALSWAGDLLGTVHSLARRRSRVVGARLFVMRRRGRGLGLA